jgi:hypothetical protein
MSSFFLPGNATDPAYVNVRDSPNLTDAKAFVDSLWPRYQHLADTNCRSDARNHFLQRFWEMYLACTLSERGFALYKVGDAGPEFYFVYEGRRIWVEAIAPTQGDGPDHVPAIVPGQAYTVPSEKVVLRFTSAFRTKSLKLAADIAKGLIGDDDLVLLAINSRGIPHAPYGADMPFFLKAFLPFGNLTLELNTQTRQVVDRYHTYRPSIEKQNASSVGTAPFLDLQSQSFVGVLHSAVDCANRPANLGADFQVLHNPLARVPLPRDLFAWCVQYEHAENELREHAPQAEALA